MKKSRIKPQRVTSAGYLNQEDPLVAAGELKKMAPNRLKLTENDY